MSDECVHVITGIQPFLIQKSMACGLVHRQALCDQPRTCIAYRDGNKREYESVFDTFCVNIVYYILLQCSRSITMHTDTSCILNVSRNCIFLA